MSWTDERVELLKKLAAEGASAQQIADELGAVTRSAVLGKARRDGIPMAEGRPTYVPKPKPPAPELITLDEAAKLRLMRSAKTSSIYSHGMGGLLRTFVTKKPVTLPKLNLPELVD